MGKEREEGGEREREREREREVDRRASYRMESQSLNWRVETWRAGKVQSKGGYDSISLVTTGNDYSPSCAPHPAAAVTRAEPPLRGPSDVERTFPLKDVTGFIARANYDANCSNDECQRWDYQSTPHRRNSAIDTISFDKEWLARSDENRTR